jgi:SAM-dependent methyltransferase
LDFGCGNAFVIEYLNEKGVDVRGIDISPYAYLVANHSLERAFFIGDVTKPLRLEPADLVISMEVAEHIEPKSSEQYVQNLASHAERYIFFTAASPNQYGVGHINCRPRAFWISLFDKYGFELNLNLTKKIKRKLGAHRAIAAIRYIIDNLLVFERKGSKRINSLKN